MNKADLIDRIASGTGLTKLETEAVVDGLIVTIMDALRAGERVDLRGFGSFRVHHRATRTARNPKTNEEVEVPAHYTPAFKPSREFRREVDEALRPAPRRKDRAR